MLQSVSVPLLFGCRQPALVIDTNGWVAAANNDVAVAWLALPERLSAGPAWFPRHLTSVPGGWLVRVAARSAGALPVAEIRIDVQDVHRLQLSVQSQQGYWGQRLTPRHAELLILLAVDPVGSTAAELSHELYGSPDHAVAIRAELSRMRRRLGAILGRRPYRFADWTNVHIEYPATGADLLPASNAPTIRGLRTAVGGFIPERQPRSH